MKTIPLSELLKQVRPLPWPVNGKVTDNMALTPEQLIATRIYRRHAANHLPAVILKLNALSSYAFTVRTDRTRNEDGTIMALKTLDWCDGLIEKIKQAELALAAVERIEVEE